MNAITIAKSASLACLSLGPAPSDKKAVARHKRNHAWATLKVRHSDSHEAPRNAFLASAHTRAPSAGHATCTREDEDARSTGARARARVVAGVARRRTTAVGMCSLLALHDLYFIRRSVAHVPRHQPAHCRAHPDVSVAHRPSAPPPPPLPCRACHIFARIFAYASSLGADVVRQSRGDAWCAWRGLRDDGVRPAAVGYPPPRPRSTPRLLRASLYVRSAPCVRCCCAAALRYLSAPPFTPGCALVHGTAGWRTCGRGRRTVTPREPGLSHCKSPGARASKAENKQAPWHNTHVFINSVIVRIWHQNAAVRYCSRAQNWAGKRPLASALSDTATRPLY